MKILVLTTAFSLILSITSTLYSQELTFNSGNKQIALIELYTSQGCSSCPPADEWVSELKSEPGLWTEFVPVVFHVSYWDYLGWKDRFSKKKYSDRQRLHKHQGHVGVVYTPGFFLNGKEWRSRFGRKIPTRGNELVGEINATLNERILKVSYNSLIDIANANLNIAILGFNYQTPINAGENFNRVLNEDFVILTHLKHASVNNSWEVKLPDEVTPTTSKYGIAIWVNQGTDLTPLQATGGWLPAELFN